MSSRPRLSIVVPVFNEQESLCELHGEIRAALEGYAEGYEVLYVDDRSTDRSLEILLELHAQDPRVRVVRFRRNFGQTAALAAGFDRARGEVIVTLDADLQNDPADIPRLLSELDRGYDVVAGWRRDRRDAFLLRKVPSFLANRLIAWIGGVDIHDTGCTLKAFRRQVVKNLQIYAEQHRFLPVLAQPSGARVAEVVVNHRPRRFGKSKYGLGRALRVTIDLLSIRLISGFAHRPLHYFGLFALPFAVASVLFLFVSTVDYHRWVLVTDWIEFALFVFLMFLLLAFYFVLLGLLSEIVVSASGMHRRRVLDRILSDSH